MKIFLGLIMLSCNAMAVDWYDMELGNELKLTQNIQLKQTERSGALLDLTKGEKFTLKDVTALEQISVIALEFAYENCSGTDLKTEMEIVKVEKTSVEVGALIERGCTLEIYIETKDFMSESFFE